ncbi:MAG: TonB family protein [Bacteroidota bacterium]
MSFAMKPFKPIFIFVFLFSSCITFVQAQYKKNDCITEYDSLSKRNIYLDANILPEFPGGSDSLVAFIQKNLQWPKDDGAEWTGTVYISFCVETDGSISGKRVKRSVHPSLDNEAMKVMDKMPKWSPGKCHDKAVPVKMIIPFRFVIN